MIVKVRPNQNKTPKLGITVTKRFGKAHQRNRFKRVVREAFRLSNHQFNANLDILIQPRTCAAHAKLTDIRLELLLALSALGYPPSPEPKHDET